MSYHNQFAAPTMEPDHQMYLQAEQNPLFNGNANVPAPSGFHGHNSISKQGRGNHQGKDRRRNKQAYSKVQEHRQQQHQQNQRASNQGFHQNHQYQQLPNMNHHAHGPQENQQRTSFSGYQNYIPGPHELMVPRQTFPAHVRQFSAEQQHDFEQAKYLHRRNESGRHYNLSPQSQQNLEHQKYAQYDQQRAVEKGNSFAHHLDYVNAAKFQSSYTTQGVGFSGITNHDYSSGMMYTQMTAPWWTEVSSGVWEGVMPNGYVEYWYAPKEESTKMRAEAKEFIPAQGGEKMADGEFLRDAREDTEQEEEEEEGEVEVITSLPNVVLEADTIGRAMSVSADSPVRDVSAAGTESLDDPAGFVVKKVAKKGASGLFVKWNMEQMKKS